jgi:hypothetical protein
MVQVELAKEKLKQQYQVSAQLLEVDEALTRQGMDEGAFD